MHWLAYKVESDRVVYLRIIRSQSRPSDVDVINNGFRDEQEALILMSNYFDVTDKGFLTIRPERAGEHVLRRRRIQMAYQLEPLLLWAVAGAYGLIFLVLTLVILHFILVR